MQQLQNMTCVIGIIFQYWRAWSKPRGIGSCMRTSRPVAEPLPKLGSVWSLDCLKSASHGPLRSEEKPDGLDNLTSSEAARVTSANDSYEAAVRLILLLVDLGISVSVENPKNSLFWLTSMMQKLYRAVKGGHETIFHSCMHGGTRDKATKFWSFNPRAPEVNLFASLALECDRSHPHQSWRPRFVDGRWIFPTKDEAAYPVLCVNAWQASFCKKQPAEA